MKIAIDGPVGSGKSTVARELAKRLDFIYVDTGALYRAVAFHCKQKQVDIHDEPAVQKELAGKIKLELKIVAGSQRIYVNGEDVSELIRTPEISMGASDVSKLQSVREFLLDLQQNTAATQSVVMDGRDIGTVILPDAEVKIYLTADDEIRAGRRHKELVEKNPDITFDEVLGDLRKRDFNDMNREIAPLKQADDAILVNSSELDFEQTVEKIYDIVISKRGIAI